MTTTIILLLFVIAAALFFEYINGFHDAANAIATVVSTKVLSPRNALLYAAVLNFFGAFFGTHVAKTIGAGIVEKTAVTQEVILCALLGAIIWNLLTWFFAIPSSSSHALIGGLVGAAVTHSGFTILHLNGLINKVIIPMFASPLIGFIAGFSVMLMLLWICAKAAPEKINKKFKFLQLISAGVMAFSHGSNDAQKVMGIITLSLITGGLLGTSAFNVMDKAPGTQRSEVPGQLERPEHFKSTVGTDTTITLEWDAVRNASDYTLEYKQSSETSWTSATFSDTTAKIENLMAGTYYDFRVRAADNDELFSASDWSTIRAKSLGFRVPVWVILICAVTMACGTMSGGWKIIRTMGTRVIKLKPIHGFAAETTAATTILTASWFGIPVSTTHTISTAIMGVGSTIRFSAVKWGLVGNIVLAWFLTIPICAILSAVLYALFVGTYN